MTTPIKSMLVIAPEASVSEAIGKSLRADKGVRVDTQSSTLAGMNGRAIKAMAEYDIILFQTSPDATKSYATPSVASRLKTVAPPHTGQCHRRMLTPFTVSATDPCHPMIRSG